MNWPFSNALGAALAIIAVAALLVAGVTTGILPIALAVGAVAVALYVIAVVVINLHRWATTRYDRGGRGS